MDDKNLAAYLEEINKQSAFKASLGSRGGNITFGNSGKGGSSKQFTFSLDSFINTFRDISDNIEVFKPHEKYVEIEWRSLGSNYFSDGPMNASITVQTKGIVTTLIKLISWANNLDPKKNEDNFIPIDKNLLQKTIANLDHVANLYAPKAETTSTTTTSKSTEARKLPLQKIFYGPPGTGKSYEIKKILNDVPHDQKERITFHPEFDYSAFIGGYRPFTDQLDADKIKYMFVPQVFTRIYGNAWRNPTKDFYLAIEEINRGNCAEIFGDMFQLLDRDSGYEISPSNELLTYLQGELLDPEGKKGIENDKMRLPGNLHIIASMNTSDQSLFPMDSAFKRRWTWEYIPIEYREKNSDGSSNLSYHFVIRLDDHRTIGWINFIEEVNKIIRTNKNLGPDKCIGNYFIKPAVNEVALNEFVNKVIFYLWNDVFKDEENSIFGNDLSYEDFFPLESNGLDALVSVVERLPEVKIIDSREKIED